MMTPAEIARQLANIADELWADDECEDHAKAIDAVIEDYCLTKNVEPPDFLG
jgi:hypothetical protein